MTAVPAGRSRASAAATLRRKILRREVLRPTLGEEFRRTGEREEQDKNSKSVFHETSPNSLIPTHQDVMDFTISRAASLPLAPVMKPPGCVPALHRNSPGRGPWYLLYPSIGRMVTS